VVCALVPTSIVAILSFKSVSGQLADQSRERLHSLAGSVGRTIYGRLAALEGDLRTAELHPWRCSAATAHLTDELSDPCGGALALGFRALTAVPDSAPPRAVFGHLDLNALFPLPGEPLHPGQSALVTRRNGDGMVAFYLIHRREGAGRPYLLIGEAYHPGIWGESDREALPATVELTLWDPAEGSLIHPEHDSLVVTDQAREQMRRSATGDFEWRAQSGNAIAAWWGLPATRRFRLPAWQVVLSEREEDVIAPMAQFRATFPLVLLASIVVVVLLGLSQIRRSVLPLAALQQGTRRIADRDFDSRVSIQSRDELEDLGTSFNTMAAQLGRQFKALSTAAEIDRAVLSSVDSTRIVDTVLGRLPDICECHALTIALLDSTHGAAGIATSWVAEPGGPVRRWPAQLTLTPAEIEALRTQHERLTLTMPQEPVPSYLRPLGGAGSRTATVLPLVYQEELLGLLAVVRADGMPDPDTFVQVRRLADQVAVALANARMVDQVRFLAFYDSLTRLPNRVLFKERLAHVLARAERGRKLVGICFLDVDHFSRINDTLGHEMGDRLVQEVAVRLSACIRRGDSVARYGEEPAIEIARLGGDEFTVMLPDLDDAQDAVRVARRILDSFAQPFKLGNHEMFVTASAGIAIYPFDGTDSEDLLKNADAAMFHAKEQGRNTYRLYSSSMNAEAMARMRTEHLLRKAVEAGEFTIWYQPIIDLRSGRVTAAEALVRWQHPELGLISPGGFIGLCEEIGLIVPLGKWILRAVCEQSQAWRQAGAGDLTISVNLSARQLHSEGLVDMVRETLRSTGMPPQALVLELTESMLMDPAGQVGTTVRELAGLGVGLAIDDFGTGYSSLSYLKHFPVGTLKIDRSFVADVTEDADAAAIVTAIIALARALDMEVVAEGVETEGQEAFLRGQGCDKLQGFLFGRPAPAATFVEELEQRHGVPPVPVKAS
jgi:diguanylate cyclase (GGDEF)-like protein